MKIKYKLTRLHPQIFSVEIRDSYDLSMLFLRPQEYYESPYKSIRGKHFTVLEFMKLYSRDHEGDFTYPSDWAGFNIPGKVLKDLYSQPFKIKDVNVYDETLIEIERKIESNDYYLIGYKPTDKETLNHELSHAFYAIYPSYKKEANKITSSLSARTTKKIHKHLKQLGYSSHVFADEVQAYVTHDLNDLCYDINFTQREEVSLEEKSKKLKELFSKVVVDLSPSIL